MGTSLEEYKTRFYSKTMELESGCIEWQAGINKDGYGSFGMNYKTRRAHKLAYEWEVGPVPEGLQLDHLCRRRSCVNVNHLEPVTCAENLRRGAADRRAEKAKTRCHCGSKWTLDPRGVMKCIACKNAYGRRYHDANKSWIAQKKRQKREETKAARLAQLST